MSLISRRTAVRFAFGIFNLGQLNSLIVSETALLYLETLTPINGALLNDVESRFSALDIDLNVLRTKVHGLQRRLEKLDTQKLIGSHGKIGAIKIICVEMSSAFRIILICFLGLTQLFLARIEYEFVVVVQWTSRIAINICKSQIRSKKSRRKSLQYLLDRRDSPIFLNEILIWTITRTRHIEETLGDFRETYENRKTKYGESAALSWCNRQTIREIWSRISLLAQILGWLEQAIHTISKHLNR